MAGAFDDLVPVNPASGFDDLIPKNNSSPASPAPAAPPPSASSDIPPIWNLPPGQTLGEHLGQVWSKATQGAGQAANDYVRASTNVFGLGDRLASLAGGTDLAAERAKTAESEARLPPGMGMAANLIGYAPVGELGIAGKVGGLVAPGVGNLLGGVIGSGAEGALAGGAGAAGRGEDVKTGALIGGAGGAALGLPGGVVGRGGSLPDIPPLAELKAASDTAYSSLKDYQFPAQPLRQAYNLGKADLNKAQQEDLSPRMEKVFSGHLDQIGRAMPTSADEIAGFIRGIDTAARTPADRVLAGKVTDNLQNVLATVPPIGPDTGLTNAARTAVANDLGGTLAAEPALTSQPVGAAAADLAKANKAFGRYSDLNRLQDWQAKAAIPGGPDLAAQARSHLLSDEGQRFAPPGTPQYEALNRLAGTSSGPTPHGVNSLILRHAMYPVVGGLIGAGLGGATAGATSGWDPARIAEEALMGGATVGLATSAFPAAQRYLARSAQQAALGAARATAATGQAQAPVLPPAALRDALRQLYYGNAAAGRLGASNGLQR